MAPTRFELVSLGSKPSMFDHYTTGLMVLGRFELLSTGPEPAMLGQLHHRTVRSDFFSSFLIKCKYKTIQGFHEILKNLLYLNEVNNYGKRNPSRFRA
jgi:hypothetical protein